MTVAIPEASTAARRGTRAPARQRRPTGVEMGRAPARAPAPVPAPARTGPRGPSGQRGRPAREPRKRDGSKRRAAAGRLTGASTRSGSALHNYQAIIAAEYVAATLLVALTPIATRQATPSTASGKLSPYVPADMIKLFAIGIVYLILEGLAAGPRGLARFTAWFGFLILIGVGLSEASNIADVFNMLAGGGVSPVALTGAQAPARKGHFTVPALGQGSAPAAGEGGGGPAGGSGG